MTAASIPAPEPTDSDSVGEHLVSAQAELAKGEHREALRLLRQAAEAAEAAGNDLRALALARSAADLANEVGGSVAPPASQVTQVASGSVEPELAALLDSGRAVRVLVKRSTRDEQLYVVRRPSNGKAVLGAREAVLVLLEPDAGFFTKA
jgi:hypothetical protein